ncbi:MAG TPA: protein kinase [Bryobacteraceae bacterium]|jgi:serine/threonine protein kinase
MHLTGRGKPDCKLTGHVIRFQSFEVNLRSGELLKGGEKIRLPEQSFQILTMLLERPREVVTRAEIRKRLWPNDTVVEFENSIHAAVRRLRLALGDPADAPQYIETLARRGYRWMLAAEAMEVTLDRQPAQPAEPATPEPESPAAHLIGRKVSHYRVLHILGGGGMGVVYAAEDLKLGRRVALKFLPEELANDRSAIERFEREARAASALNHPNICTIHGVEEHEEQPFIVMEMLEGRTLRELISADAGSGPHRSADKETLPIQTLLDIAIQTLEGLDAAHQKGIIHRDIKPANIFVTASGQVKVLDFGLAKQEADRLEQRSSPGAADRSSGHPNLTRTGVALGTAGYTSPEQVRGERLDARTDLFSFGLVLYEMAVGQRAFTGETAAILHEAILHHAPTPVRALNPRVPAKLEEIIDKAIEKDRHARYQTAGKIRSDLELLRRKAPPRHGTRWWAAGLGGAALLMAAALFWVATRHPSPPTVPSEINLRQLTANSAENHVLSAVISPDGNRLAYSDIQGLHVKNIESGEVHGVAQPQALKSRDVEWECVAWFPDGATVIANAYPSGIGPTWFSPGSSIWTLPLRGGSARKLRDDAAAYSISADGSGISFGMHKGRLGERELWLMGPAGEHPRKLYETDENSAIGGNTWSPDGKRILYPYIDAAGHSFVSHGIEAGSPHTVIPRSQALGILQIWWLTDGRLIYARNETQAIDNISNLWAVRLDGHTGEALEKPKRLTNWTGFDVVSISATTNSRRLAFLQWAFHETIYVADLGADGARLRNPTHFTLTESRDLLADWTQDSRAIILWSNRTGRDEIYKQFLNRDTPELIVTEPGGIATARVSPDGKWIFYVTRTMTGEASGSPQLERVPITGGASQRMFPVRPGSSILCARSPSQICAIAERSEDAGQIIVTAFDALERRGSELIRLDLDPASDFWAVDLSPDGTRIAALNNPAGPIQILSLHAKSMQVIRPRGSNNLQFVHWASNGGGLYVSTGARKARALWHLDLQGNANLLWENRGGNWAPGIPSPDGRHIAIQSSDDTSNVWMMENF